MWRRLSVLSTAIPLVGLTMMADPVRAADPPEVQLLLDRIRVLEERLNKLEEEGQAAVDMSAQREILKEPPPSGRCPDGIDRRPGQECGRAARHPTWSAWSASRRWKSAWTGWTGRGDQEEG